jgi:hypothetical protein
MRYFRNSVALPFALLGTLPVPLFAQDAPEPAQQAEQAQPAGPMCGGQSAQWLGGSAEASDIATAEGPLATQMKADDNLRPYVAFRVSGESQDVRIEAEAEANGDPSIVLSKTDGTRIADNDDANGSLSSQLTENLQAGDYCVQLVPVGDGNMTATVQVTRPDMPPLVENTSLSSCTPTPDMPALFEGDPQADMPNTVQTDGGLEYLRLSLSERTSLTLRADSASLDPIMALYDANGQEIAQNDDTNGLNPQLDFPAGLPAGEYCVGVAPLSPGQGNTAVSIAVLDPETMVRDAYRKGTLPPASADSYPMKDIDIKAEPSIVALSDGSAQWFQFDLDAPSVLVVNAYGSILGVDTHLSLFASNGATMGSNDDANDSTDAQLGPIVLPAGTYRMALTDVNNSDNSAGGAMRPVSLVFELYEKAQ